MQAGSLRYTHSPVIASDVCFSRPSGTGGVGGSGSQEWIPGLFSIVPPGLGAHIYEWGGRSICRAVLAVRRSYS